LIVSEALVCCTVISHKTNSNFISAQIQIAKKINEWYYYSQVIILTKEMSETTLESRKVLFNFFGYLKKTVRFLKN
jgi:hypothetical protein